jgi:hypothetical protein
MDGFVVMCLSILTVSTIWRFQYIKKDKFVSSNVTDYKNWIHFHNGVGVATGWLLVWYLFIKGEQA